MVELLFLFAAALAPLLWFRGQELILGHDSGFRLNFVQHLSNLSQTWHANANFGIDWSLYQGFIPIQAVETLTSFLAGSLVWGERIAFVFWFFAMGVSMLLFVRYFFPQDKFRPIHFVAPIFWMYNLYVLNGWAIAERAKFSLYIALPLAIVIFFKTVRNDWSQLRGAIYFGFLFLLANGGGSPPLYGALLITSILLVIFFTVRHWRQQGLRAITTLVLFGLSFLLFNAYFLLPQMQLYKGNYGNAVSERGGIEGLIAWEREISKQASIGNIVSFAAFPDWYDNSDHEYARAYLDNPILQLLRFLPIVAVIFGLVFLRRHIQKEEREILLFLGLLGIVGLFFSAGSHPPFGIVYTTLMRYVPGFAMFRSSLYKFAPTVYLPLIIFFGYFFTIFLRTRTKREAVITASAVLLSLGIIVFHYPFLTGSLFAIGKGFTTKVTVPAYVPEMSAYIAGNTKETDRILLVPPLDTGYINSPIDTYNWGYYSLDVLPRISVNRSFLANDSSDDSITALLYRYLAQGDAQAFMHLANIAGVTHILFRGDVRLSSNDSTSALEEWRSDIAQLGTLATYNAGFWTLFLLPGDTPPMVYGTRAVSSIAVGSPHDAFVLTRQATMAALLRSDTKGAEVSMSRLVEAECFYCKEHEYDRLVEAVTLPAPGRVLPLFGDRQMNRIDSVIKKEEGSVSQVDARLAKASMLLTRGRINDYEDEMNAVATFIEALDGRTRDVYVSRTLAYAEAHGRDKPEIMPFITSLTKRLKPFIWQANGNTYRFGVNVVQDGQYTLWVPDRFSYQPSFSIDGTMYQYGQPVALTAGYHHLQMTAVDIQGTGDAIVAPVFFEHTQANNIQGLSPQISYHRVTPTQYTVAVTNASTPFVLVLNQRFHPGWQISVDNGLASHYEVNGYANAWIIPKVGTYTLSIIYAPQKQVRYGALITGATIVGAVAFLLAKRKKNI